MNKSIPDPPIAHGELLDALHVQVWGMIDARTYGYANAAHAAFLGVPRDAISYRDIFDLLPEQTAAICVKNNILAYESKQPVESEEWALDAAGNRRLLRIHKAPRLDPSGKVAYLSCAAEDITDYRHIEQQLKEYSERLKEMVQDEVHELSDALWGTISSLVHLAESRDDITGGHLRRLAESCRIVASILSFNSVYSENISYEFIRNIQQASQLHDIGKVGIRDSILLKPGKLTREEFEEMKRHTTIGAQTLMEAYPRYQDNSLFLMAIEIASSHHERWDGKGYPKGLKGDQTPLSAQIVAICDVYDALRSTRAYKPPYSHEESLAEIRRECGTHFNPALCDAFFHSAEEIRHIYDSYTL